MNPIKQRFNEEVRALLKRLEQSRKNGTGMTLSVEQVGVAHELISVACDIVVNDIAGKEVTDENHNP